MGDKYASERYDASLAACSDIELNFDGEYLRMLVGSGDSYHYPAASGISGKYGRFDYSVAAQMGGPGGPIPEGEYWVNPEEIWENAFYKRGSTDSWGDYRLTIHPHTTTVTYKRGGFFIHGGKSFGSIGCIDLANGINKFVADIRKLVAKRECQIPLTVDYGNDKGRTGA
jgi:hypothetical protein